MIVDGKLFVVVDVKIQPPTKLFDVASQKKDIHQWLRYKTKDEAKNHIENSNRTYDQQRLVVSFSDKDGKPTMKGKIVYYEPMD